MEALTLAMLGAGLLGAVPAKADGMPPFYGYSGYFGQPAVYYTRGTDVQQATTMRDGYQGFGVTTYTAGGPFWRYKPNMIHSLPYRRHREVIRVRG